MLRSLPLRFPRSRQRLPSRSSICSRFSYDPFALGERVVLLFGAIGGLPVSRRIVEDLARVGKRRIQGRAIACIRIRSRISF